VFCRRQLKSSNGSAAFVYGCVLPPEWRLVAATATASAPPLRPRPPPLAHWQPCLCLLSRRWLPLIFADSLAPT